MRSRTRLIESLLALFAVLTITFPWGYSTAAPAASGPPAPTQSPAWEISCVDCPKDFVLPSDRTLRLDAAGRPHVVYDYIVSRNPVRRDLQHAVLDGGVWITGTVAHTSVSQLELALDAGGAPRISFFDGYSLQYAAWTGSRPRCLVPRSGAGRKVPGCRLASSRLTCRPAARPGQPGTWLPHPGA